MLRATPACRTGIVWHPYEPNKTIRANLRVVHRRVKANNELLRMYNVNSKNTLPKRRHYGPIWTIDPREIRSIDKIGEIASKFPISPELKQRIDEKLRRWEPIQQSKPPPPKKLGYRAQKRLAALAAAQAKPAATPDVSTASTKPAAGKAPAKAAAKAAAKPEAKKAAEPKKEAAKK